MMYTCLSNSSLLPFDFYGGILAKTLVEEWSIFLYLFFTKASTRNVLWCKIDFIVHHVSYFKFATRAIKPHFHVTSGFIWNRSIEQWHTKKAGRIVIRVQLDAFSLFCMLHKVT